MTAKEREEIMKMLRNFGSFRNIHQNYRNCRQIVYQFAIEIHRVRHSYYSNVYGPFRPLALFRRAL